MTLETPSLVERIKRDPQFQELVAQRSSFAWTLSIIMMLIYFGFILMVAFEKNMLATPLFGSVTTVGIPVGLFVIISAFVLTGIYVARANSKFDEMTKQIIEKVKK
jgi:uncharacterized membrane protein (DUF485 family)